MSLKSFCRRSLLLAAAALLGGLSVHAQEPFPSKPVTLIVNFPPGGVTDGTFRRLAERFKAVTGESLIILNKPGRGVAAATLAMAKPDGYTLGIIGRTQMSLYEQLKGKQPYHPVNDFTWIANITSSYFGLYVPAKSPYRSVQDLVKAAKAQPNGLRYGTSFGHGGLSHVPMEEFSRATGIQMVHVPFKGDSDAVMTLVQGEIEMIVAGGSAMPFVDEGRLRLLAWLAPQRNPRLPEVPTMRDLGYPIEVIAPVGVGGPKGMDPAQVAYFEKTFRALLDAPEIRSYLDQNYQRVDFMDSKTFTAWAQRQLPIEKEIVQRFNLATDAKP
jgi:tripartite-type tricarboxylate transporter receptor subunit TctC